MPSTLKGWHSGELKLQRTLGFDQAVSQTWKFIVAPLPQQHKEFHTTRLPFIPVVALDEQGRPWGSIFAGAEGKPGFVQSPDDFTLSMDLSLWPGDPFVRLSKLWHGQKMLLAGIGIEFPTRRRNKFAGHFKHVSSIPNTLDFNVQVQVNQALGNCPKYINVRDLVPYLSTSPAVAYENLQMSGNDRLPQEVIEFIHEADTVFIGTTYVAPLDDAEDYPSHLGMNQRGGLPGFVRVRPSDGRTVILPDFSGNRLMSSLGNIEVTPLASLTFVSFTTGDILYLSGEAKNLIGPEAQALMRRQNMLTIVRVTGYTFVRDALPARQHPDIPVKRSPYSPPIKFLVEEQPPATTYFDDLQASLIKIEIQSPDLAIFTFKVKDTVNILPGQAVALDFSKFVGPKAYQHMAEANPRSVNDDRIRTWTVSSAHTDGATETFDLTMREKPGGLVTGLLFSLARGTSSSLLADMRPLNLSARLVGVAGEFVLPPLTSGKLLFVAGGIGVTPFLSMLKAMADLGEVRDVVFVLSTREPEILIPLVSRALGYDFSLQLTIHAFSSNSIPDFPKHPNVTFRKHKGRLSTAFFNEIGDIKQRAIYLCGSPEYEKNVELALGGESARVKKEGFNY